MKFNPFLHDDFVFTYRSHRLINLILVTVQYHTPKNLQSNSSSNRINCIGFLSAKNSQNQCAMDVNRKTMNNHEDSHKKELVKTWNQCESQNDKVLKINIVHDYVAWSIYKKQLKPIIFISRTHVCEKWINILTSIECSFFV